MMNTPSLAVSVASMTSMPPTGLGQASTHLGITLLGSMILGSTTHSIMIRSTTTIGTTPGMILGMAQAIGTADGDLGDLVIGDIGMLLP